MSLVYVPIVAGASYLLLRKCLPKSARQLLRQVSREVAFALAFAASKLSTHFAATRSSYIWKKRQTFSDPLVTVLDTLLKVDGAQASLDTSAAGHDSITILSAISTVEDQDCDITKLLGRLWASGNGFRVIIPMNEVSLADDVTIRIVYRGHSNVLKRYPSQIFSARYAGKSSQTFLFPPYSSSESIKRGIGFPRVLCASFEESGQTVHAPEVKLSSGLRRTFYTDVDDDPCLQKNVITFSDASLRACEMKEILVTTSKSNITCNKRITVPSKVPQECHTRSVDEFPSKCHQPVSSPR